MPKEIGEIAIDRMYADNNKLSVGDTLKSGKKTWKITGLVALSDYSALFQNNNDTMFDAIKFGVGIVTKEEFLLMKASLPMITHGNIIKSQRTKRRRRKGQKISWKISEKISR